MSLHVGRRHAARTVPTRRIGAFFALEGPDAIGKGTTLRALLPRLEEALGRAPIAVREPGGTPFGEAIRAVVLSDAGAAASGETKLLLMSASRRHLVDTVVRPALAAGDVVVSDRFALSTYMYQGRGQGVAFEDIDRATEIAVAGDCWPDVTVVLALDAAAWRRRRADVAGPRDAFERDTALLEAAQTAYLDLAARFPNTQIVSAEGSPEEVAARVLAVLRPVLEARGLTASRGETARAPRADARPAPTPRRTGARR